MNFRKISNTLTVIVVIILLIIINIDPVFAEVTDNNINFGKIDEFVISKMKSERIPGVSLAIVKGFTSGYKSYFGFILPTRQTNHEGSVPAGYLISSAEDMSHYLIAK